MRIEDVKRPPADVSKMQAAESALGAEEPGRAFRRRMGELSQAERQRHIAGLVEKVIGQGGVVAEKVDLKEVQKYRELLAELIFEAGSAYAFEKSDRFDGWGRHRSLAMIRTINAKAEEMVREALKEQKDNLKILQLVDEIRGLVVDLFL